MPRTHSIPLCDVSWTCACPRPSEQQLHPFPSLTPARTPARVSRSNRGRGRRAHRLGLGLARPGQRRGPESDSHERRLERGYGRRRLRRAREVRHYEGHAAQIRTEFDKRHGPTGTSSSTGTFAPRLLMVRPTRITPHDFPAFLHGNSCVVVSTTPRNPSLLVHPSIRRWHSTAILIFAITDETVYLLLQRIPCHPDQEVMYHPSAIFSTHRAAGGSEGQRMND